ncbi:hypothetical protein HanRHA438_Chr09g0381641 [Helianthus annuus]|nr:hypothetical protein HanRHA438_Chr09g0381641 [Helianthus annuus]
MGGEVLPMISLSCLRAGGGQVSAHLGEPRANGGRVVDLGHGARGGPINKERVPRNPFGF